MDKTLEFVSYKKVIIFGAKGSGKTCLTTCLETGSFSEDLESNNGKIYLI